MLSAMVGKRRTRATRLPLVTLFGLARRNVFRQAGRTATTLAAIGFGVMSLAVAQGFLEDVFVQLAEAIVHSQSGHIQLARQGFFEHGAHQPEKYLVEDPVGDKKRIATIPEVQDVMARLSFSGLLNNGRADLSVIGEGIEPDAENRLGTSLRIVAGRRLASTDKYGAVVGKGVAKSLGLKPGDRVVVVMSTSDGAMNSVELEIVGVFQSFSKEYDDRGVKIPLSAAQTLLNTTGASALVVLLHDTAQTQRLSHLLKERTVWRDQDVRTWVELNDFYLKTVELYKMQFGGLQVIILVMVLLSVVNAVNTTVFERVSEFGTFRALGNRNSDVLKMVVAENALLGLIGGALGVVGAIIVGQVIQRTGVPMPPPPNSELAYVAYVRVTWFALAGALAVGFTATVLAACVPAWRVSVIQVAEALRQSQ